MTCKSFHPVSCGESKPKELIQIQGEKKETLRRYYRSNCSNLFSTLSVTPTRTQYVACFFSSSFFFWLSHLFRGVPLRCKTPTQLQGRQMDQQVPNHSCDAGTLLPPITSLSLSFANWVSSLTPQLPLSSLPSSSSCVHVLLLLLKPALMDSCLLKMDYNKQLT